MIITLAGDATRKLHCAKTHLKTSGHVRSASDLMRVLLRDVGAGSEVKKKRRPLGRTAYTARIKQVLKSQKAQNVAKSFAGRMRKACQQVVDRGGAAADN